MKYDSVRHSPAEIVINGKFLLAALEGMPRVAREVTRAMDRLLVAPVYRDVKVTVLAPQGSRRTITLDHIVLEEVGRRTGLLWEQIDLPLALRRRYCINFTNTAPVFGQRGCVVVHDAQFRSSPASHGLRSKILYGVITPIVARRYQRIVSVSRFSRDQIVSYGICDRSDIEVVYNGIDHVLAQPSSDAILATLGIAPGGYILANSSFHAHKNLQTVFDAVAADAELARKLVLFGGPLRDELAFRGLTVPDGVRFAGRVNDADLASLMRNAALFLFPSTTEGFGLPPLEAMALGCPTICSDAGAMPEVCGNGACLIPPQDPIVWHAAITRLLADPVARAALSQAGRRRATTFTWTHAAQRYLDLALQDLTVTHVTGGGLERAIQGQDRLRSTGVPTRDRVPARPVSVATTHPSIAPNHD